MHFSRLALLNFRNYESFEIAFGPALNCITGDNGEGKTNILEALHYLALTKGFISRGENISLKENEDYFMVEGTLEYSTESEKIQCSFIPSKGKKVIVNGRQISKLSLHIGSIPLIAILPNDTSLIYGPPAGRRKFMDGFISQYDAEYLRNFINYEKAIEQRNAQLGIFAETHSFDTAQLSIWNQTIFPAGIYILAARKKFISEFLPRFEKYFRLLVTGKEKTSILYETSVKDNSAEGWSSLFNAAKERDLYSQRTTEGIHKDDLSFYVNGQPVKDYGSQGQQKTFVIALRLAQYELLATHTGKAPLLLLDDIFDKLDLSRMKSIAEILDSEVGGQVFLTDTSLKRTKEIFEGISRHVEFFQLKNYQVESVKNG